MSIKNNKGFSLIEILVTVGLIGVLSTIAIPAYKNYRIGAFKTVIKSDAGNAFKAYHTYNAVEGNFCGTFSAVGLDSLTASDNYTNGFIGFDSESCPGTINAADYKKANNSNITATNCELKDQEFDFGVASPFSNSLIVGYAVDNDKSTPVESSSAYCDGRASACDTAAKCADATDTCDAVNTSGTWRDTGNSISSLCP